MTSWVARTTIFVDESHTATIIDEELVNALHAHIFSRAGTFKAVYVMAGNIAVGRSALGVPAGCAGCS